MPKVKVRQDGVSDPESVTKAQGTGQALRHTGCNFTNGTKLSIEYFHEFFIRLMHISGKNPVGGKGAYSTYTI